MDRLDTYLDYIYKGSIGVALAPVFLCLIIMSPIALLGWIGEKVYDWWKGF
jgi:hypothetical protein